MLLYYFICGRRKKIILKELCSSVEIVVFIHKQYFMQVNVHVPVDLNAVDG